MIRNSINREGYTQRMVMPSLVTQALAWVWKCGCAEANEGNISKNIENNSFI